MKQIPIPRGYSVENQTFDFRWTRNPLLATPFGWIAFLVFPILAGLAYMGFIAAVEFSDGKRGFLSLCIALGMGTFPALRFLINRTVITLDKDELFLRESPIPPSNSVKISRSLIADIFSHEHVTKNSYDEISRTYEVWVRGFDKSKRCLMKDLPDSAQAIFLANELQLAMRALAKRDQDNARRR